MPVGSVITVIWATSAVVGLVTGVYTGLEVVSPAAMIFFGYVFGINIVRTGEKSVPPSRRASGGAKSTTRGS